ncbi:MAG: hypothetical protein QS99_C0018G0001, partial [archaeon GW2011_AR4]
MLVLGEGVQMKKGINAGGKGDIVDFAINRCRQPNRLVSLLQALFKWYYDIHYKRKLTSLVLANELGWRERTVRYYLHKLREAGIINPYYVFTSPEMAKKAGSLLALAEKGRIRYVHFEGYYATILTRDELHKTKYKEFKNRVFAYTSKNFPSVKVVVFSPKCLGVYFPRFIEQEGAGLWHILNILEDILSFLEKEFNATIGIDYAKIHSYSHNFRLIGRIGFKEFTFINHRLALEHYNRRDKFKGEYVSIDFSAPAPSLEITAKTHDELLFLLNAFLKQEDDEPFTNANDVEAFCKERIKN